MFIVAHVAAGALIGQALGTTNPAFIFGLSMLSHFLLDVIPHGDAHHVADYYGPKRQLKSIYATNVVDTSLSIILTALLLGFVAADRASMAWGIIGSVAPDFLVGMNEVVANNKFFKWFTKLHFKVHNAFIDKLKISPLAGGIGQAAIIVAMLAAL